MDSVDGSAVETIRPITADEVIIEKVDHLTSLVNNLGAGYQNLLEMMMYIVASQSVAMGAPVDAISLMLPNLSGADIMQIARNKHAIQDILNADLRRGMRKNDLQARPPVCEKPSEHLGDVPVVSTGPDGIGGQYSHDVHADDLGNNDTW